MKIDNKLTYTKIPRNLEINRPQGFVKNLSEAETAQPMAHFVQPRGYSKTDGILSVGLVCVISGGTTRERDFLTELERKHSFRTLEVIFLSTPKNDGGLTPRMMRDKYNSIYKNGKLTIGSREVKLENIDSVYMFTDVDHYEEELKEILLSGHQSQPRWIISNPDFEIWLYYCFCENPETDLAEVCIAKPSSRSSLLKTINGRLNNGGGLDPRKAFEHLEEGIMNSKRHYSEQDGFPTVLSTQMHIFAEDVLMKLGNEYHEFLERIRVAKENFRLSI